jgi:alpha-tubulin suppressor-like RCC1 family protein
VPGVAGAVQVLTGPTTYALLSNGTVLGWGEDKTGQLGDNGPASKPSPIQVKGLLGVVQIARGGFGKLGGFLLALRADGTVWALGGQHNGELGDNREDTPALVPVQILRGASGIAASNTNGAAVKEGRVFTWGTGSRGGLGYPAPTACGSRKAPKPCALTPHEVPGLSGVTRVSLGDQSAYVIANGELVDWGKNEAGQLGDGTTADSPAPVPFGPALQVAANLEGVLVQVPGPAKPARMTAQGGEGRITVSWLSASKTEVFQLTATQGAKRLHTVKTTAHSYTFTGLTGVWRVGINGKNWGRASISAAS